ncbi:hypothetical protein [Streptacidiphilus carbonis]|uniref:hypothetical protein n=1 Tax=Streptacidiphilus carbonis TaxID=105422 RepID=UPI000A019BF1|nr:hypothetical protein [Streptacidiphilus carbonis]
MTDSSAPVQRTDLIGTRDRTDVEHAFEELEADAAAPQRQTQYSRGALAGYLWALGRGTMAPVTGARPDYAVPDLVHLTAEVDASVAQLDDRIHRMAPRDYLQGVHDALAWLCGLREDRPSAAADGS